MRRAHRARLATNAGAAGPSAAIRADRSPFDLAGQEPVLKSVVSAYPAFRRQAVHDQPLDLFQHRIADLAQVVAADRGRCRDGLPAFAEQGGSQPT